MYDEHPSNKIIRNLNLILRIIINASMSVIDTGFSICFPTRHIERKEFITSLCCESNKKRVRPVFAVCCEKISYCGCRIDLWVVKRCWRIFGAFSNTEQIVRFSTVFGKSCHLLFFFLTFPYLFDKELCCDFVMFLSLLFWWR